MDQAKLHRKAWELLLERVEEFMRIEHDKHQALMICDDVSNQYNRSLAMKHASPMSFTIKGHVGICKRVL